MFYIKFHFYPHKMWFSQNQHIWFGKPKKSKILEILTKLTDIPNFHVIFGFLKIKFKNPKSKTCHFGVVP